MFKQVDMLKRISELYYAEKAIKFEGLRTLLHEWMPYSEYVLTTSEKITLKKALKKHGLLKEYIKLAPIDEIKNLLKMSGLARSILYLREDNDENDLSQTQIIIETRIAEDLMLQLKGALKNAKKRQETDAIPFLENAILVCEWPHLHGFHDNYRLSLNRLVQKKQYNPLIQKMEEFFEILNPLTISGISMVDENIKPNDRVSIEVKNACEAKMHPYLGVPTTPPFQMPQTLGYLSPVENEAVAIPSLAPELSQAMQCMTIHLSIQANLVNLQGVNSFKSLVNDYSQYPSSVLSKEQKARLKEKLKERLGATKQYIDEEKDFLEIKKLLNRSTLIGSIINTRLDGDEKKSSQTTILIENRLKTLLITECKKNKTPDFYRMIIDEHMDLLITLLKENKITLDTTLFFDALANKMTSLTKDQMKVLKPLVREKLSAYLNERSYSQLSEIQKRNPSALNELIFFKTGMGALFSKDKSNMQKLFEKCLVDAKNKTTKVVKHENRAEFQQTSNMPVFSSLEPRIQDAVVIDAEFSLPSTSSIVETKKLECDEATQWWITALFSEPAQKPQSRASNEDILEFSPPSYASLFPEKNAYAENEIAPFSDTVTIMPDARRAESSVVRIEDSTGGQMMRQRLSGWSAAFLPNLPPLAPELLRQQSQLLNSIHSVFTSQEKTSAETDGSTPQLA